MPAGHERPISRAGFLKGLGAAGLAAAAGPVLATPADARSTTATPGARQPTETGWRPKRPPLTTPWTDQVGPHTALGEYPRPQLTRPDWLSLNGVWQFAAAAGQAPPIGTDLPERILVPYPVESALSGIMRHESRMYYRRRFVVPPAWRIGTGNRLLVHLDAVDHEATVWVNGTEVGSHRGGYDRFSVDVTDALAAAPLAEQELVVGAYDPTEAGVQPLGKQRVSALPPGDQVLYYTPASGIWQSVWAEPVPEVHIDRLRLVPRLADSSISVTAVVGRPGLPVRATAYAHGHPVATATGTSDAELRLPVPDPHPWTPDDPFLYRLVVEIVGGDRVGSYVGLREVTVAEVGGAPHLVLNGRFVFQLSTLQQGFWPDGIYTPATDAAMVFDIAHSKRLGFNTIRKHVKVEPDRWYFHADRLGQLVWQDMPSTATGSQPSNGNDPDRQPPDTGKAQYERELRRMIEQHRNHPSIVMWIPFNEGWGQYDIARIAALVKHWDPTRIVNELSGANVGHVDAGGGDVLDLHNIGFSPPEPVPSTSDGRAAVIGEFGAYGLAVDGHLWDPSHTQSPAPVPDAATLNDRYVAIMGHIAEYARSRSLSAANYNLFEDVEHQVNGLHTYDRRVLKMDPARVRAANLAVLSAFDRRERR